LKHLTTARLLVTTESGQNIITQCYNPMTGLLLQCDKTFDRTQHVSLLQQMILEEK
jgi:hypothetical protein